MTDDVSRSARIEGRSKVSGLAEAFMQYDPENPVILVCNQFGGAQEVVYVDESIQMAVDRIAARIWETHGYDITVPWSTRVFNGDSDTLICSVDHYLDTDQDGQPIVEFTVRAYRRKYYESRILSEERL